MTGAEGLAELVAELDEVTRRQSAVINKLFTLLLQHVQAEELDDIAREAAWGHPSEAPREPRETS